MQPLSEALRPRLQHEGPHEDARNRGDFGRVDGEKRSGREERSHLITPKAPQRLCS